MRRIIILIILLINLVSCNSQVSKKISNFEKLSKIDNQIKEKLTDERTYKSLDSLKNVVDGADAELYIETYKNAIIYDTDKLLSFLKLNNKKIDEDVVSFFEQDQKIYNEITQKLSRTKKNNTNLISIDGKWKEDCNESLASVSIVGSKAIICVNTNQIYIESKIIKSKENFYNIKLIKAKDLGRGGMELSWENFSNDNVIATIEVIDVNSINFKWLGFYNSKTKNREWLEDADFSSENSKGLKLEKCVQSGVILDADGYTNLRKDKNGTSDIIEKIMSGKTIEILDDSGNWWFIQTTFGNKGYVYKTKIKSE